MTAAAWTVLLACFCRLAIAALADETNALQPLIDKAEAGDAAAQLQLGRNYIEGAGVRKDADAAIKWFLKAAAHYQSQTNKSSPVVPGSALKGNLVTLDGRSFPNPTVDKIDPEGVFITYKMGRYGFGMAQLGFDEMPPATQRLFGYDPRAADSFAIQQEALREIGYAEAVKRTAAIEVNRSNVVQTLLDIVVTYRRTHTYMTNETGDNIYTCGDMACDVWNMVVSKHISAKIAAGDVHDDIKSIAQANHAWVLAEVGDGEWLALEATGGYVVRREENSHYFFACRFETAKDFRDFEGLEQSYRDSLSKCRTAASNYNESVNTYNAADLPDRSGLKAVISQREAVLQDKVNEMKTLKKQLDGFKLTDS